MVSLDGKLLAAKICNKLKDDVSKIIELRGYPPHLCVILVGKDPASHTYVNAKKNIAKK